MMLTWGLEKSKLSWTAIRISRANLYTMQPFHVNDDWTTKGSFHLYIQRNGSFCLSNRIEWSEMAPTSANREEEGDELQTLSAQTMLGTSF